MHYSQEIDILTPLFQISRNLFRRCLSFSLHTPLFFYNGKTSYISAVYKEAAEIAYDISKKKLTEPALFCPSDTTKPIKNFPEICVSTFSQNIIEIFASLDDTEKIAELYTANGAVPVYKIRYKNTDIAFTYPESARRPVFPGLRKSWQWAPESLCFSVPAAY